MERKSYLELNKMSDEDLMENLQNGVYEAFDLIVHRFKDRLHNFIFRYTHNSQDSEDLVQETFLRVYRSRHSYQRIAKLSTWIFTIASNLAKTDYKKKQRMQTFSIHADDADSESREFELTDDSLLPDEELHLDNSIKKLEEALMQLNEDFREALVLRDIQQLSYEEISDITGVAMGTVKSRINRARAQIQELIGEYVFSETF